MFEIKMKYVFEIYINKICEFYIRILYRILKRLLKRLATV